jgi:hypothetical protein
VSPKPIPRHPPPRRPIRHRLLHSAKYPPSPRSHPTSPSVHLGCGASAPAEFRAFAPPFQYHDALRWLRAHRCLIGRLQCFSHQRDLHRGDITYPDRRRVAPSYARHNFGKSIIYENSKHANCATHVSPFSRSDDSRVCNVRLGGHGGQKRPCHRPHHPSLCLCLFPDSIAPPRERNHQSYGICLH